MSGTFDPSASPVTGGYALVDSGPPTDSTPLRILTEDLKAAKALLAIRRHPDDVRDQRAEVARIEKLIDRARDRKADEIIKQCDAAVPRGRLAGLKDERQKLQKALEHAIRNKDAEEMRDCRKDIEQVEREIAELEGRADAATYKIKESRGKGVVLPYTLHRTENGSTSLEGIFRELAEAERHMAQMKSRDSRNVRNDASSFKPGDYVMDRDSQKMGVVVESSGGKTKVEWRDGTTTVVKTSSLKG